MALPQMHLYLAKRNQGFLEYFSIGIFANRLPKTWLQQNVYDNIILLGTKSNNNFPMLPAVLLVFFFLKWEMGVWDRSCFLLPSNHTDTFTSCFKQLSLNSMNCIKMMALVQEHDVFFFFSQASFPNAFLKPHYLWVLSGEALGSCIWCWWGEL